jgi:hypothetical protein
MVVKEQASSDKVTFDGSNWEDLTRLVTLSRLAFLQDSDYTDNHPAQCGHLARHFRGPALDWVGSASEANANIFTDFEGFVSGVRNAFGVSDEGLSAQRRGQLEALKWQSDLPIFFAEFDRLTHLLMLTGDAVKIALVRSKLPVHVQKLLAEQALNFANYETMRERLLTMWNLDPSRRIAEPGPTAGSSSRKPRCGRCGKRGHTAPDCRSKN